MPFFIVAGNIAWEFIWSFIYHPDMGNFFISGYQICFFLDVFIFIMILFYGTKQSNIPIVNKNFFLIMFALILMWIPLIYFFVKQGFDTSIGANSGYLLNLIISLLCPIIYFRADPQNFSILFTIFRFIGTGCITISMFLIYPNNHFVQTLGVCCFIADLAFTIYLIKNRTKESII